MHKDLAKGGLVNVRELTDPRDDVRVLGLHPLNRIGVGLLELPEPQQMLDVLECLGI